MRVVRRLTFADIEAMRCGAPAEDDPYLTIRRGRASPTSACEPVRRGVSKEFIRIREGLDAARHSAWPIVIRRRARGGSAPSSAPGRW